MDTNTFYELRERLYMTAAAGCEVITEDFRLKRALEAFQPMSEVNKVFGRLYQMCEKLFTSGNVASDLIDCIALADALAVTQGSFMDKSECAETEADKLQLEPQTMSYKRIQSLKETIISANEMFVDIQEDLKGILEPRIFSTFIKGLKRKTETLEELADCILSQLECNIAELVKAQVDLKDTSIKNKTSYYVNLVCKLYGYQENDWYLSLIEEEDNPKSIRIAAIHALGCSEKNGPKLLELYKTQKAAIKKEVLIVLAKLNSPGAEDLWKGMAEKYKVSYDDLVAHSKSDIWANYVRTEFYVFIKDCEEGSKGKGELTDKMFWLLKVLHKKYQLEDCFSMYAEKYSCIDKMNVQRYIDWRKEMNLILIENLLDEDVRYIKLIKTVYETHKEFYFPARFFLALKETKEEAFNTYQEEIRQNRECVFEMLQQVKYSYISGCYYMQWRCLGDNWGAKSWRIVVERDFPKIKVFDTMPENVISYLTEVDYFSTKKDGIYVFNGKKNETTDKIIRIATMILDPDRMGFRHGTKEYESYKNVAIQYALNVNRIHSVFAEIRWILLPYYKTGTAEEYIEIIKNHELHAVSQGDISGWALEQIDRFPMTKEEQKNGLYTLRNEVEKFHQVSKQNKQRLLDRIDRILKKY